MLVRVDYLDSWSFTNCTFQAGAEGWGSLAILNLGTASNIRFEDCDISNAGYTTGNILRMNSAAVGWTFERCTFDLSTMGAISGVTLYDVSGAQDWTFDTCSFIGPSSIAGTV